MVLKNALNKTNKEKKLPKVNLQGKGSTRSNIYYTTIWDIFDKN